KHLARNASCSGGRSATSSKQTAMARRFVLQSWNDCNQPLGQITHCLGYAWSDSQPVFFTTSVSPNCSPIFSSWVIRLGWMTITMFSRKIIAFDSWRLRVLIDAVHQIVVGAEAAPVNDLGGFFGLGRRRAVFDDLRQ